jgi:hypothetical protein
MVLNSRESRQTDYPGRPATSGHRNPGLLRPLTDRSRGRQSDRWHDLLVQQERFDNYLFLREVFRHPAATPGLYPRPQLRDPNQVLDRVGERLRAPRRNQEAISPSRTISRQLWISVVTMGRAQTAASSNALGAPSR